MRRKRSIALALFQLECRGEICFEGLSRRLCRGWIVSDLRAPLHARVIEREWVPGYRIEDHAVVTLLQKAVSAGLGVWQLQRLFQQERVISVGRIGYSVKLASAPAAFSRAM